MNLQEAFRSILPEPKMLADTSIFSSRGQSISAPFVEETQPASPAPDPQVAPTSPLLPPTAAEPAAEPAVSNDYVAPTPPETTRDTLLYSFLGLLSVFIVIGLVVWLVVMHIRQNEIILLLRHMAHPTG